MGIAIAMSSLFSDLTALYVLQNSLLMVGVAPAFLLGMFYPYMHSGVPLVACKHPKIISIEEVTVLRILN